MKFLSSKNYDIYGTCIHARACDGCCAQGVVARAGWHGNESMIFDTIYVN